MRIRIGYGLGTHLPGLTPSAFWDLVDELEKLRFDSLWLSERAATGTCPDPVTALAAVAGRTSRLKLGSGVFVLPGRNPVLFAKELATIDFLSNGRLLPAFGLGVDDPREMEALGVDRRSRAAWADEATDVIRRLFREENVTHHGRFFHLSDITLAPRPVQHPPDIWFGGDSPAALRRVGRRGDGWLPSFIPASVYAACRVTIEAEAAAAGREIEADHYGALVGYLGVGASNGEISPRLRRLLESRRPGLDPSDVVPAGAGAIRELLEAYIDAGASKFVLVPVGATGPAAAELGALREEVLAPLGAA